MQRSSPVQEEETKLRTATMRNELASDWSYLSLSSFALFSLFYTVWRWHRPQWKLQIASPYRRVMKSSQLVLFILRRVLWTVKPDSSHHFNNQNTDSSHTQHDDCLMHCYKIWKPPQVNRLRLITVLFSRVLSLHTLCGRSAQYVDRCEIFNITFHIRLYLNKCIFLWEQMSLYDDIFLVASYCLLLSLFAVTIENVFEWRNAHSLFCVSQ